MGNAFAFVRQRAHGIQNFFVNPHAMSVALRSACCEGDIDTVEMALDNGAEIETIDNDCRTPLFYAAINGYIDIVNMLLENGAQVEIRDKDGISPLCIYAQTDVVRALLSAGADVNANRTSALHVASVGGYLDIVNTLIGNGAHIDIIDNVGRTPLWFAAACEQTDIVRSLVSAGADLNCIQDNHGLYALCVASLNGYTDIVSVLLNNGAQVEIRDRLGRTPLSCSAFNGHTECIGLIMGRGADVDAIDYSGQSPVSKAVEEGNRDAVMALIHHGANLRHLEYECIDPLTATAATDMWYKNDVEILQLLINNGSRVNSAKHGKNQSALMTAAHNGRLDVVEALLENGADIYDRNFDSMQAIDVASYCGHTDVVEYLSSSNRYVTVLSGGDLNPHSGVGVDCRCNTAMHLITDLQTMMSLLENGADVEAENIDGLRPIHRAVRTGIVELVELLIQHGADVDAADVFGNRPLHDAVCHGLDVVQLLVQHGAKLNVQNIDGKTPLHIAVERKRYDVILFLLIRDADVGLTDVWRNTPLHYFTSQLIRYSGFAESADSVMMKCIERNTVDVDVYMAMHTKSHADDAVYDVTLLSSDRMPQVHDIEHFFCLNNVAADCYGNTPLHYAVGVYGQLKMFRVRTNVTETVDFLMKCGDNINAQNKDGLTPLHVARGEEAIVACLRHSNDQSFTITDKRGRNFWHLLFLNITQNKVELGTIIRPLIDITDSGKYNVDDLNRTPLHYACMNRNPWNGKWDWLAKEFIKKFTHKHVNKRDKFGRTALHYAAIGDDTELTDMLKTKKAADETIQDNYQNTSSDYLTIQYYFSTQKSHIRLMKSSSFIARHLRDISACVRDFFADSSSVQNSSAKMHDIVRKLVADCDRTSHVLNAWHGCRYDYSDVTARTPVALEQGDDRRLLYRLFQGYWTVSHQISQKRCVIRQKLLYM